MLKRIHVNQHKIRSNLKNNTKEPVITVKTSKSNTYAHEVDIKGPTKVIYRPDKPLSCGAKVWIETKAKVVIDNKTIID
jgi:hypothetical protein